MILVDTTVWIEHLRSGNTGLESLLLEERVLGHPFVLGELACGNLKNRREIFDLYRTLPQAEQVEGDEVLHLVEQHTLHGSGLGWIDVHILASARLTACGLWTLDKTLSRAAKALGVGAA